MSKFIFAGTPYKRNPDPNTNNGSASPEGLYPWSVFRATVGTLEAGVFTPDSTLSDAGTTRLDFLFFTTDLPLISTLLSSTTGGVNNTNNIVNTLFFPSTGLIATTTSGGSTSVTAADFGSVVTGYSGSGNTIPDVSGFPAALALYTFPESYNDAYSDVLLWANGAILNAPVGPAGTSSSADAGTATRVAAPTPIILDYTDYTATIRGNNNQYAEPSGKLFQIVGLYAKTFVPAPPPPG
jgi:hypothetical protein